jgi:transcriptional regulator with XRE-family HTH domain
MHSTMTGDLEALLSARNAAADGTGRRLREAAGLTQGELAGLIGMDQSQLSRWEAGLRRPRGPAAIRWARALRVLEQQTEEVVG